MGVSRRWDRWIPRVHVIQQQRIDRVIICLPWQTHGTIQRLLRECEQMGVAAYAVPDLFHLTKNQMKVEELNGIPLVVDARALHPWLERYRQAWL